MNISNDFTSLSDTIYLNVIILAVIHSIVPASISSGQ